MRDILKFFLVFLVSSLFIGCGPHSHEDEDGDDHDHEHSGIVLEPEQAKSFGIEYETVTPSPFSDVIKTTGVIEASSSDVFTVSAKKNGIVTLSPGLAPGREVTAGQTLATITSEGVQGGDVAKAAAHNLEAAKSEYLRLKPLYEEGLVPASTFREAERAYKEAEALSVKGYSGSVSSAASPSSGTVQSVFVSGGEYVEVGAPIAIVAKNSNFTLKADLPAREARHYPEIRSANFKSEFSDETVNLSEMNGKKISSTVVPVAEKGYIPVYFSFEGNPLTGSGFAEVYLLCGERQGVISAPKGALIELQGNNYVYVKESDHGYEKRLVKTGASDGERIEILEGLAEGDVLVTKGASVIRMAEVSSIAPPAHNHSH